MESRVAAAIAGLVAAVCLGGGATATFAQASASSSASDSGSITTFIAAYAKKSGKKLVVDPKVQAQLAQPEEGSKASRDDFLNVLLAYGLVAVERGDTLFVIPDAMVRTMPVPLATGNEKHPDAEVVTRIIHVKTIPATSLVPLMRSLVPQFGHLAAVGCTNDLILVDRYANAKRIEQLVEAVDKGEPYKPEKCVAPIAPGG
jgi:general secretion pathway protein D